MNLLNWFALSLIMSILSGKFLITRWQFGCIATVVCALLLSPNTSAQSAEKTREMQRLTSERQMLTKEVEQYQKTLDILQAHNTRPAQNNNPAVKKLALEMISLKKRLIAITEQEVTLLQEQITAAKALARTTPAIASTDPASDNAIESKPLRSNDIDYTLAEEAENVKRLHSLLASYYTELQELTNTLPTEEELTQRETAQQDAQPLNQIPFSTDKVRLNGTEGSTALTQITQRLMDPDIPESRRDIAPICTIKTRLFGSLIGSENRSLKPVGKNHYVARIRLQPGDTTLRVLEHRWEIQLPQNANAGDFLITLYRPPGNAPELHIFAIDDLLAADKPHIPAWLPEELNIKTRAG